MSSHCSLDVAGRRRSPATTAEFHLGRTPGNKGMSYPADPPRVEEIVAVMRQAGGGVHGDRLRGLVVVLWRAGLRISEARPARGRPRTRAGRVAGARGKGRAPPRGRHGRMGLGSAARMARSAGGDANRTALLRRRRAHARQAMNRAGRADPAAPACRRGRVRRRFAPHQLRHADAVEMAREGLPLNALPTRD